MDLGLVIGGFFLGFLAGGFAFTGIFFGVAREYCNIGMFVSWILLYVATFIGFHSSRLFALYKFWIVSNFGFSLVLSSLGLLIVLMQDSSIAVHVIVYSLFMILYVCSVGGWVAYLSYRSHGSGVEPEPVVQMDSMSSP